MNICVQDNSGRNSSFLVNQKLELAILFPLLEVESSREELEARERL